MLTHRARALQWTLDNGVVQSAQSTGRRKEEVLAVAMSMTLEGAQLPSRSLTHWLPFAAIGTALLSGPIVAASPRLTVATVLAVGLVTVIFLRPSLGAYTFLCVAPLVVGLERGAFLPLVRPNEALILLLAAALLARKLFDLGASERLRIRLPPVDAAILLLAVTGSIMPLLWMVARGKAVTQDDLLYALGVWKYYAVYLVFRTSIRTEQQVRTCLWLSMAVGSVVGVIGIIQALDLLGVPDLLARYYAAEDDVIGFGGNRASATIAHSQAFGDVMVFNIAIAIGFLVRRQSRRGVLLVAAALFALASLASGQFSGAVALFVGVLAVGFITGHLRRALLALVPMVLVALLILQPVLESRLENIEPSGVPQSWVARWENLNTYFLPSLTSGYDFLFGVQLAARVPAPETLAADWVYIESGHVWLLWVGGIPFLLAFLFFLWRGVAATARVARSRPDAVGVAAIASFASLVVLGVVTTFDPHLTLRGSADLSFPLLALALTGASPLPPPAGERSPEGQNPFALASDASAE